MKEALKVFLKIGFVTFITTLVMLLIAVPVQRIFDRSDFITVLIFLVPIIVGTILCLKFQIGAVKKVVSIILLPITFIVPSIVLIWSGFMIEMWALDLQDVGLVERIVNIALMSGISFSPLSLVLALLTRAFFDYAFTLL